MIKNILKNGLIIGLAISLGIQAGIAGTFVRSSHGILLGLTMGFLAVTAVFIIIRHMLDYNKLWLRMFLMVLVILIEIIFIIVLYERENYILAWSARVQTVVIIIMSLPPIIISPILAIFFARSDNKNKEVEQDLIRQIESVINELDERIKEQLSCIGNNITEFSDKINVDFAETKADIMILKDKLEIFLKPREEDEELVKKQPEAVSRLDEIMSKYNKYKNSEEFNNFRALGENIRLKTSSGDSENGEEYEYIKESKIAPMLLISGNDGKGFIFMGSQQIRRGETAKFEEKGLNIFFETPEWKDEYPVVTSPAKVVLLTDNKLRVDKQGTLS